MERGDLNRAEPDGSIRDPPTAGNGELDLDEFITGMVKFKPKEEEHGKTSMKSGIVWFRREGPAAERRFCPLVLVLLCASKGVHEHSDAAKISRSGARTAEIRGRRPQASGRGSRSST